MEHIRLYLTDIEALRSCEAAALLRLTPERRARAERIRAEKERLLIVAAGLLLRRVLGVTDDGQLQYNEFGRPELSGSGPCFNLSHGGDQAVLAVCSVPVGVDLEPVGERLPIRIPRRFLRADELVWLEADPSPERFAWLWTRLESALKADGRGFGLETRNFSVLESGQPWHLESIQQNGYCLSCAAGTPIQIELERLSVGQLLNA